MMSENRILENTSANNDYKVNYQYIETLIPSIYNCLNEVESIILKNEHIDPQKNNYENMISSWKLIRSKMAQAEAEFFVFCQEEWEWLDSMDQTLICCHTISVISAAYINSEFKLIDNHDKSIILFGCLFHDIAKRGPPIVPGKDPFHPFTSASKALKILDRLGWIPKHEFVEETCEFINQSYFTRENSQYMDNEKLEFIIKKLLFVTGIIESEQNEFENYEVLTQDIHKEKLYVYEILAIVLMHQSFDFDYKFPNHTPISESQMKKFTSPRLLKLLCLLFIGDNGSYNLPLPVEKWEYIQRVQAKHQLFLQQFSPVIE